MRRFIGCLSSALALVAFSAGAGAQQGQPAQQPAAHDMPHMLDQAVFAHLLLDQLEGRFGFADGNSFRRQGEGWIGTDENRAWLLTEGRVSDNELDDGIHEVFYGRAISTYFDAMIGTRWDLASTPTRGWGAIGASGS